MRSVLLLLLLTQALAFPALWSPSSRPAQAILSPEQGQEPQRSADAPDIALGWVDPRVNGGRFLDYTLPLLGEPLNVIISGLSDPFILTEEGFHAYSKSIGYSEECLGLHYGNIHEADLGDGNGRTGEMFLARQYYFPIFGTCWESFAGGHHFRAWKQNGTAANSGAWFIGASKEEHSRKHHKIVDDGYNVGRDWLVGNAKAGSQFKGISWKANVEWREGLLEPGSEGVNHGIEQDGRVAILTVNRLDHHELHSQFMVIYARPLFVCIVFIFRTVEPSQDLISEFSPQEPGPSKTCIPVKLSKSTITVQHLSTSCLNFSSVAQHVELRASKWEDENPAWSYHDMVNPCPSLSRFARLSIVRFRRGRAWLRHQHPILTRQAILQHLPKRDHHEPPVVQHENEMIARGARERLDLVHREASNFRLFNNSARLVIKECNHGRRAGL